MAEDYEDWFCDNEFELRAEFIEMRDLEAEFQQWAYLKHCSDGSDGMDYERERWEDR